MLDALEQVAVASTESYQSMLFNEVLHAIALLFGRMPDDLRIRSEGLLCRSIAGLSDHMPSQQLQRKLEEVEDALRAAGSDETADTVARARRALFSTVGEINSRATRGQQARQALKYESGAA